MAKMQLALIPWLPPRKEVQLELFPLSHDGLRSRRKTHVDERVYADRWYKANQVKSEHEVSLLEGILTPEGATYVPYISDRDSIVAAAVVQWMATNCGTSFLYECEREIAEAREARKPFENNRWLNREDRKNLPHATLAKQIKEICSAYLQPDGYGCTQLQNEILNFVLDILRQGLPTVKKTVQTGHSGRVLLHKTTIPGKDMTGEVEAALATVKKEWEDRREN